MNTEQREIIRARLKQLEDRKGSLTPEAVVRDARNPKSVLHGQFEWDDKKAGNAFRIQQARGLIQQISIHSSDTRESRAVPYYVHDPLAKNGDPGYRSLTSVQSSREASVALMNDELCRIESLLTRLEGIANFLGMKERVQGIVHDVHKLRDALITPND